jgi:hypothetical protein
MLSVHITKILKMLTLSLILDCGDTLVAGAVKAVEASCNMGCGGNGTYVSPLLGSSFVFSYSQQRSVWRTQQTLSLHLHGERHGAPRPGSNERLPPWTVAIQRLLSVSTSLQRVGALTNAKYILLSEPEGGRALPNQIDWPGNNTALACMDQCAAFGYPVAGVEVGQMISCKSMC